MPSTNIWIMCVIMLVLSVISWYVLDESGFQYRFMRKILEKRWLYSTVITFLILSSSLVFISAWVFPSWWIYIFGGIWLGTIGQLIPWNHGIRSINWLSYKQAYEIYVTNSYLWEKNIKRKKEKRAKRKAKRSSK